MCLIVVAWQQHPVYDVVLAANRDEFHARPSEPAHWWASVPGLFAGRDAKAGGAWCGADRAGRLAAVTNVRDPEAPVGPRSRGELVRDFFVADHDAAAWAVHVAAHGAEYAPFNLLVGDRNALYYVSNRDSAPPRRLAPGIVAISNGHWGERWPKTERAEARLREAVDRRDVGTDTLLALLHDQRTAPDAALPDTGIGRTRERFLSSMFIASPRYGTRATTMMRRRAGTDLAFAEEGFDRNGQAVHRVQHTWPIETCFT